MQSTVKLLIVEENLASVHLITDLLKCEKGDEFVFEVTSAHTLTEASKILSEALFDIVLLSLSLPDSQGLDAFKSLSANANDIPIVILSGHEEHALGILTVRMGAQDYLNKGKIDAYLLRRTIRHAIERAKITQALRFSEARLERAQRVARIGVWEWDIVADTTACSDEVYHLFGLEPPCQPLPFNALLNLVHAEDRERVSAVINHSLSLRKPCQMEYRVLKIDGSIAHVETRAEVLDVPHLLMVGTIQDISDRKQHEVALRESERRLDLALEGLHGGVWDWNLQTGEVYYSHRWCAALGYDPADIPSGITFWESIVHPEDMPRVQKALAEHLEGRTATYECQHRLRMKSGEWRWTLDRGKVVEWGHDGSPRRMVGTDIDITDRIRLEEQFRQAQKMEAIGLLAGGIAHDFNNMLTVVKGYCDLMHPHLHGNEHLECGLTEIKEAANRASALTHQLLAFGRKQHLRPTVLDLNAVIGRLEQMLRRVISENITFRTELALDLWMVHADKSQVEQVIMNLVVNAKDAMPSGGVLTISTSNETLDARFVRAHAGSSEGFFVKVSICDTGLGMDKEVLGRMFEPFFTTKEPGKGTGLGLSTVYGIVKQSHGYIDVHSLPGAGSTFDIYLPRTEAQEEVEQAPIQLGSSRTTSATVLLAEDEPQLRELFKKVLNHLGFRVLATANGAEALQVCSDYEGPIDLLLTDMIMPGMNGRILAEQIQYRRPGIKAVYMSGYTGDALAQLTQMGPHIPFLKKPFTPADLSEKIGAVLEMQ